MTLRTTRRGAIATALGLAAAPTLAQAQTPAARQARFAHGVASGDPLTDRVILWTRVSGADGVAEVSWKVARDPDMRRVVRRGRARTDASRDYTVKVDADRLRPDTRYYYQFTVNGVASPIGRTRTLPAEGAPQLKFAVFSCSNYPFGYFHAYAEAAKVENIDLMLHLGDYIYEYGPRGFGAEVGARLGRLPDPAKEIVTLEDYRLRYAQYRSDPDLQAAHAAAPWLVIWDDHESTNNPWKDGAENHNPDQGEGDWAERRAVSVQAYYEWQPIRDPQAGRPRLAINRTFHWGELASFLMLETRHLGRDEQLDYLADLGGIVARMRGVPEIVSLDVLAQAEELPAAIDEFLKTRLADPSRQLLGAEQEAWLAGELKASVGRGATWQILGNAVTIARVRQPNLDAALSAEAKAKIAERNPGTARNLPFSRLELPWNLDSWNGYPAARARLYAMAEAAQARLVVVTGDTHTAWACELYSEDGARRLGVEFGATSVTSSGAGDTITRDMADLPGLMTGLNPEVRWYDPYHRGFTLVTLTREVCRADYVVVSDVTQRAYEARVAKTVVTRPEGANVAALTDA